MKKKVIIFGAGGTCLDILDTLLEINKQNNDCFDFIGFLDDDEKKIGTKFLGYNVIGKIINYKYFLQDKSIFFINGIGSPKSYKIRKKIIKNLDIPEERFLTIIHPKAYISSFSQIGYGSVIFANVTIGVNVQIGNHVLILPNTVVNHDTKIGDYTLIASNVSISGNVKIGENCYIGTGSCIKENISISSFSLVGMSSNVINDVEENSIVFGNPARKK